MRPITTVPRTLLDLAVTYSQPALLSALEQAEVEHNSATCSRVKSSDNLRACVRRPGHLLGFVRARDPSPPHHREHEHRLGDSVPVGLVGHQRRALR